MGSFRHARQLLRGYRQAPTCRRYWSSTFRIGWKSPQSQIVTMGFEFPNWQVEDCYLWDTFRSRQKVCSNARTLHHQYCWKGSTKCAHPNWTCPLRSYRQRTCKNARPLACWYRGCWIRHRNICMVFERNRLVLSKFTSKVMWFCWKKARRLCANEKRLASHGRANKGWFVSHWAFWRVKRKQEMCSCEGAYLEGL